MTETNPEPILETSSAQVDPSEPDQTSSIATPPSPETLPSPFNSLVGATIAGGFGFGLYKLTHAIATSFATKPITSSNPLAQNISAAVRTLVVGASTLATGVFAIAAVGLILLALQVAIQPNKPNIANK